MGAIQSIKKEKVHLQRLASMRKDIYHKVGNVKVEVCPSKEPINPQQKETLKYRRILPGGRWGGLYGCAWFRVSGVVPKLQEGKNNVLHLNIGGEGLAFMPQSDEPFAAITNVCGFADTLSAPLGKSIISLNEYNGEFTFFIDGGYNGFHNIPIGDAHFRFAEIDTEDVAIKDFYYDYLTILTQKAYDKSNADKLEQLLNQSFSVYKSVGAVASRQVLAPLFEGKSKDDFTFTAVGHSHLDLAWLWPIRETKRKAARTFINQLNNSRNFSEYVYGASQPWQFEYIQTKYPELFGKLLQMHDKGKLELQGGMYVESDTNITSLESLIMQIFYGKKYFREQFGEEMKICWLPDVFGYNGNLPQIITKSGLPYFMTIKLSWNEHNKFPHRCFNWYGIDGSCALVHMPPDETYNSDGSVANTLHALDNYPEAKLTGEALMLYGIGDGGGGPSESHIEMIARQKSLRDCPKVVCGRAVDFFERIAQKRDNLPQYNGELYLEKHQGTYTTQGRNKRFNRKAEYALQDVEYLATAAFLKGLEYPQDEIDAWWKEVLLYQFHDIIPGSSITRVYTESRKRYETILCEIEQKKKKLLSYLCKEGDKTLCFNPTSFAREVGNKTVKPYGMVCKPDLDEDTRLSYRDNSMSNGITTVVFANSGEICSVKYDGKEYCKEFVNRLKLFYDKPLYYNAWDIWWKFHDKKGKTLRCCKYDIFVENDRIVRRNFYRFGRSSIIQDVTLYSRQEGVFFKTKVDYHTTFKMLRAEFAPSVFANEVKCDIQGGSIFRSTKDVSDVEKAQFEICAHKYVDVSDGNAGVSLLNDCKYGHRVKEGLVSLNLLRSPIFPDPKADRGEHSFTYEFLPHKGCCGVQTLKEGYFLNKPLYEFKGAREVEPLFTVEDEAVVIETIKKVYGKNAILVRLYEALGNSNTIKLQANFAYSAVYETNLVEEGHTDVNVDELTFTPYEIKTVVFQL